jgi:hypothetical protein
MKLRDLLNGVQILKNTTDLDIEIRSVCCDSRQAAPGSLFVAISGFAVDGHQFIQAAAEKGAAACVCEKIPQADIPYIQVPDSRAALATLSRKFYGDPTKKNDDDRRNRHERQNDQHHAHQTHAGDPTGRKSRAGRHKPEYDRRRDAAYGAHDAGIPGIAGAF